MRPLLPPLLLLAAACGGAGGSERAATAAAAGAPRQESCEECHARIQPGLVADHEASPHRRVPLGCASCHGTDHDRMFREKGAVAPGVCGECHPKALEGFARSRHGGRLRGGALDAPLLDATAETGGCTATGGCHSIQKVHADGSVGRCGSCHVTHAFRNAEAREPRVCLSCHGGSDHPQHEAWLRSAHSLPSPSGAGLVADCVACHGGHDVSDAVVHGVPPVAGSRPPIGLPESTAEEFERARGIMLGRCAACHTRHFARSALEKADFWRRRGAEMVEQAAAIVRRLDGDGLLDPAPRDRLPNPLAGHALRLGGAQVFDGSMSLPERIHYEMLFRHYPALWRSGYHTDPERTSWEFNDDLKSALDRLRAVDREARKQGGAGG